jgi:MFS family permease
MPPRKNAPLPGEILLKTPFGLEQFPRDFVFCLGASFSAYSCISVFFLFPLVLQLKGFEPLAIGGAWIIFEFVLLGTRGWVNRWLTDRGSRPGMILGSIVLAAGVAVLSADLPYPMILLGRSMMGAGWGLFYIATTLHQARVLPSHLIGRGFGLAGLAPLLPQLGLIPLAEWMVRQGSPGFLYALSFTGCVLAAVFSWKLSPAKFPLQPHLPLGECLRESWSNRSLRALLLSGSLFAFSAAGFMPYVANAATEWGISGSSFLWPQALSAIVTRLLFGGWVDRYGKKLLFPSFFCIALGTMISMIGGTACTFVIGGLLHGLGMGLTYPLLYSLVARASDERSRTALFTLFGTFIDLLWAVAPLAAAALAQALGFGTVLRGSSLLIAGFVAWMWYAVWPWLGEG